MEREFSVCQWLICGSYDYEVRFVPLAEAVRVAFRIANSVGGRLGTTTRIIIVDGGDSIVWEWQFGKGQVFPEPSATATSALGVSSYHLL